MPKSAVSSAKHRVVMLVASAGVVAGIAVLLHVMWSFIVAQAADILYPDRIYDVTRFDNAKAEARSVSSEITAHYITQHVTPEKALLIGSSFTFGYPHDAAFALHAALSRAGIPSLNVSWLGASLVAIHETVCAVWARKSRPAAMVIEIPIVNELYSLRTSAHGIVPEECGPALRRSMVEIVLGRPLGLGWARFLFDPYRGVHPNQQPNIAKVPDHYFATPSQFVTLAPRLRANLERLVERAKSIGLEPIVFITPVYLEGVAKAGADDKAVAAQLEFAESLCREVSRENCVSTAPMQTDASLYSNITHINAKGAEVLAGLLRPKLQAALRGAAPRM